MAILLPSSSWMHKTKTTDFFGVFHSQDKPSKAVSKISLCTFNQCLINENEKNMHLLTKKQKKLIIHNMFCFHLLAIKVVMSRPILNHFNAKRNKLRRILNYIMLSHLERRRGNRFSNFLLKTSTPFLLRTRKSMNLDLSS